MTNMAPTFNSLRVTVSGLGLLVLVLVRFESCADSMWYKVCVVNGNSV